MHTFLHLILLPIHLGFHLLVGAVALLVAVWFVAAAWPVLCALWLAHAVKRVAPPEAPMRDWALEAARREVAGVCAAFGITPDGHQLVRPPGEEEGPSFTQPQVLSMLDRRVSYWRERQALALRSRARRDAAAKVDAYREVQTALFGKP